MQNLKFLFSVHLALLVMFLEFTSCCRAQNYDIFIDPRDSIEYKTINIAGQTWMCDNLSYKTDSGFYAYKNQAFRVKKYGYLYNRNAALEACPVGWHLPSVDEYNIAIAELKKGRMLTFRTLAKNFEYFLKIKQIGTFHYRNDRFEKTLWFLPHKNLWTSDEITTFEQQNGSMNRSVKCFQVNYMFHDIGVTYVHELDGYPVRCVKD